MKRNRAFPGHDKERLTRQRRAKGNWQIKNIEKHVARYLGVSNRAIRFMTPRGYTASDEMTLDTLRDMWLAQHTIEIVGSKNRKDQS
jgi:hypothetical protein